MTKMDIKTGTCRMCGNDKPLWSDGTVIRHMPWWIHSNSPGRLIDSSCDGSGMLPVDRKRIESVKGMNPCGCGPDVPVEILEGDRARCSGCYRSGPLRLEWDPDPDDLDAPRRSTDTGSLHRDIAEVLNAACAENDSDTPDYILAAFLVKCLDAFTDATQARDKSQEGESGPQAVPEPWPWGKCEGCGERVQADHWDGEGTYGHSAHDPADPHENGCETCPISCGPVVIEEGESGPECPLGNCEGSGVVVSIRDGFQEPEPCPCEGEGRNPFTAETGETTMKQTPCHDPPRGNCRKCWTVLVAIYRESMEGDRRGG